MMRVHPCQHIVFFHNCRRGARGSVESSQCTTTSTATDGTLIGGSGTTGEGSFAAKFHFSHDPRSHVVQTGSELGSC